MNPPKRQSDSNNYEETLRRLAQLPAPTGLQERVQARLATANKQNKRDDWRAFFSKLFAPQSSWRRGLAAAAIVLVIFGVGWGIAWSIQPPAPAAQIAPPVGATVSGGFSSAGAIRTPPTLQGPAVKKADNDGGESAPVSQITDKDKQDKHPAQENKAGEGPSLAQPAK